MTERCLFLLTAILEKLGLCTQRFKERALRGQEELQQARTEDKVRWRSFRTPEREHSTGPPRPVARMHMGQAACTRMCGMGPQ